MLSMMPSTSGSTLTSTTLVVLALLSRRSKLTHYSTVSHVSLNSVTRLCVDFKGLLRISFGGFTRGGSLLRTKWTNFFAKTATCNSDLITINFDVFLSLSLSLIVSLQVLS